MPVGMSEISHNGYKVVPKQIVEPMSDDDYT